MKSISKKVVGLILGLVVLGGLAVNSVSARPRVYVGFGYHRPYYGRVYVAPVNPYPYGYAYDYPYGYYGSYGRWHHRPYFEGRWHRR